MLNGESGRRCRQHAPPHTVGNGATTAPPATPPSYNTHPPATTHLPSVPINPHALSPSMVLHLQGAAVHPCLAQHAHHAPLKPPPPLPPPLSPTPRVAGSWRVATGARCSMMLRQSLPPTQLLASPPLTPLTSTAPAKVRRLLMGCHWVTHGVANWH